MSLVEPTSAVPQTNQTVDGGIYQLRSRFTLKWCAQPLLEAARELKR
jgi:hypothetical protein